MMMITMMMIFLWLCTLSDIFRENSCIIVTPTCYLPWIFFTARYTHNGYFPWTFTSRCKNDSLFSVKMFTAITRWCFGRCDGAYFVTPALSYAETE